MRRYRSASLAFATVVTAAACGGRVRPAPTAPAFAPAPLSSTIDSLVADRRFANAHWGILIVDPSTSDTLYSLNAGKLFLPASNQKLLTASTALAQLGPEYRFTTRFVTNGAIRNGTLEGDLFVVGGGDPSFSDAMRGGEFRTAFDVMADSLVAHGIRRITGTVEKSGDAFPDSPYGYGWEFDDADAPYGAGVDELFVNDGLTRVRRPGPRGDTVTVEIAIRDPAGAFLDALLDALTRRLVTVGRPTGARASRPDAALTELFDLRSPPLRDILPKLLKPSQNQIAEILFKTLGRERTGVGTADSGRRVVERQLLAWGADSGGFAVRDGSGLSRHDYVTPGTIVRVLGAMREHRDFAAFYDALPIGGVDGTIANRMKGTPAEGNVHAKTGTVDKARSLSGYVTTADGRLLLFSFLCNNFSVANRDVERVQDEILSRLATMPLARR